ncbi:MAG: nicotinamide-nucleotide amidohydrolase family protein [Candidatus Rokubacteria bacterium]|nr:nicotinamide-nucleotide amidohydrolase family protein [Candidatus Rokubacteria bacterium]
MTTVEFLIVAPDPAVGTDAAASLARFLQGQGLPVRGRRVVVAEEGEAERALRQAVEGGGLVVCLGEGEGAEVVRQALARLVGSRLVLSDRVLEAVAEAYARRGQAMPRRAEGLALVPQGTTVLVAADGGEPGLLAETVGALVVVLPSEPRTALALAREHLLPRVPRRGAEPVTLVKTLRLAGLDLAETEARLGAALRGVAGATGRALEAADEVWVRLRLRGPTLAAAEALFRELDPALRGELGPAWYGTDDETLEQVVGRLLRARGLTIALAESCTGGLVSHRLTEVSGSSAYFERAVVVYSNAAKQALLDVPEEILRQHGAVSAECAEAMARGVRLRAGTDLGVSVTGIAGPEGGTPTKPVGLTFIALADARGTTAHRHRFDRDREGNKALAATMALDLVRRYCLGLE